MVKEEQYQNLN